MFSLVLSAGGNGQAVGQLFVVPFRMSVGRRDVAM